MNLFGEREAAERWIRDLIREEMKDIRERLDSMEFPAIPSADSITESVLARIQPAVEAISTPTVESPTESLEERIEALEEAEEETEEEAEETTEERLDAIEEAVEEIAEAVATPETKEATEEREPPEQEEIEETPAPKRGNWFTRPVFGRGNV